MTKKDTSSKIGKHITKEQQELLSKALEVKEFFVLRKRQKALEFDLFGRFDLCLCDDEGQNIIKHTKKCLKYRANLIQQKARYHKTLKGKLQKTELKCLDQSLTVIMDMLCSMTGVKGVVGNMDLELIITGVEELGIKCKDMTIRSLEPEDFGIQNKKIKN